MDPAWAPGLRLAHALLALVTLAAVGELPDWGRYLAFLNAFLADDLGNLTYDFVRFSPGLAVAAGYLIGAAALVLLMRERPGLARREGARVVALGGTGAYGIVLFFYFVDRSAFHVLVYVCLPLVMSGTIWLAFIMRKRETCPRGLSRIASCASAGGASRGRRVALDRPSLRALRTRARGTGRTRPCGSARTAEGLPAGESELAEGGADAG